MINKKDDSVTLLEFQKIKSYPLIAKISLILGIVLGTIAFLMTKDLFKLFLFIGIGIAIYIYLAFNYRCPDCRAFLWNIRNSKRIKRCSKCQAQIRE